MGMCECREDRNDDANVYGTKKSMIICVQAEPKVTQSTKDSSRKRADFLTIYIGVCRRLRSMKACQEKPLLSVIVELTTTFSSLEKKDVLPKKIEYLHYDSR